MRLWMVSTECNIQIIKLYTCNLYNAVNQCYPNKFKNQRNGWGKITDCTELKQSSKLGTEEPQSGEK